MADVNITITIPSDKVAAFRAGFLKADPIPDGWLMEADEFNEARTEKDWFMYVIKVFLHRRYKKGKLMSAFEATSIDVIFE